ncbi:3-oxo-tetronate 4-phosphate decarboxylase [Roseibium polysiphoniae]|uniref:3-oxo-tetronate 4-phosphate decarboxylase n=1 Tax=Roseibium polysiphoniae TaxID=2571221 RepID=A0ABR9CB35_9HYPH|nr:3-oxo-tetronate 4-phosphate decarboxylase [Roseibium polysiphoniae]MBD8877106.1 aldolase [Roseibium polysiphoniae]
MTEISSAREKIALYAKSLFDRGLTPGSSGNISMRLSDGSFLVTPTGSSMGFLDPGRISHLGSAMELISGDAPTKEIPLHSAFYDTRHGTGAVVHLHSTHSVALSLMPDVDPDNVLPPLTAYGIMKLGKVKLLPFFMPGDDAMGEAVRGLAGKRTAVLLANHGPVVAGKDLESAIYAMEELEETAKLAVLLRGIEANGIGQADVERLVKRFDIQWDD